MNSVKAIGLGCGLAVAGLAMNPTSLAADCRGAAAPAATLLFPYFEVDVDDPAGRTTLVAIGNADASEPALAHVVVWTNRGLPTVDFDLHLAPNAVQTINLRDLFVSGFIPTTGGDGFPTCTTPVTNPVLGAEDLALLRAKHTGAPVAPSDTCWSSAVPGGLAVGFVTVDAANGCSATVHTPKDEGYFLTDGSGLASLDNTLVGDFFLVHSSGNNAQGFEAIHLEANAARFADGELPSFYSSGILESRADHRAPLATEYRSRFLNGGPFDGGTDLLLWLSYDGWITEGAPIACGNSGASICRQLQVRRYAESGAVEEPLFVYDGQFGGPVATRLSVGDEPLPVATAFGQIDIRNEELLGCVITPIGTVPLQMNALPVHVAQTRFSVGANGFAIESFCDSEPPAKAASPSR
jgi:hypothetical protein